MTVNERNSRLLAPDLYPNGYAPISMHWLAPAIPDSSICLEHVFSL
jgi:hypothetical protein